VANNAEPFSNNAEMLLHCGISGIHRFIRRFAEVMPFSLVNIECAVESGNNPPHELTGYHLHRIDKKQGAATRAAIMHMPGIDIVSQMNK